MFNPYVKFQKAFIERWRRMDTHYFVAQTFKREDNLFKETEKKYFLLTHYKDKGKALEHFEAVARNDNEAAIIDTEVEEQRNALLQKLEPGAPFVFYSSLVGDPKQLDKTSDKLFAEKVKKWIQKHKNWHVPRDYHFKTSINSTFGELFVNISFGSLKARPRLEEVENL